MLQTGSIEEMRATVAEWREAGDSIGFVPTMGNLHRGHASLIEHARRATDRVVVSVFVNPAQFGEGEDFGDYPRTLELDALLLKRSQADMLFAPEVSDMYPFGHRGATKMSMPELTDELCGASRPGHFDGVITVVTRLFFMVQPDVAIFGQKDYQQLLIIRRLVQDMSIPVRIDSVPTMREADGLAMSSRNQYLSKTERVAAPALHRVLNEVAAEIRNGERDYELLATQALEELGEAGFRPEYIEVRDALTLAPANRDTAELVVLAAARLGRARLIDNVVVDQQAASL